MKQFGENTISQDEYDKIFKYVILINVIALILTTYINVPIINYFSMENWKQMVRRVFFKDGNSCSDYTITMT